MSESPTWCFVTPEYPPTLGGVADYSKQIAEKMAEAGEKICVLAPGNSSGNRSQGVRLEPVLGKFGPIGFWRGSKVLDSIARPRRIFLQWVPHGFRLKSMNLLLIFWLVWRVVIRRDKLWIMVHEPFLRFEGSFKQRLAGCVHRVMVWVILRLAERAFSANRKWVELLYFWKPRSLEIEWLPVSSNVSVYQDEVASREIHYKYANGKILIGSFGTFGPNVTLILELCILNLLKQNDEINFLIIGKNSENFAKKIAGGNGGFENRIFATGVLNNVELSVHITACDFFLQLNTEGVSTRNTTLMAILAHGKTGVGNIGIVSEKEWNQWGVFYMEEGLNVEKKIKELASNLGLVKEIGIRAKDFYSRFISIDVACRILLAGRKLEGDSPFSDVG